MLLHPKFQPHFYGKPSAIPLPQAPNFLYISGIIHIHHSMTIAIGNLLPAVPVHLRPVVHMVRKADFVHTKPDGVFYHILHGIVGIVAVICVHMIINKHLSLRPILK